MSVEGVILAAGFSKRAGQFKPALLLDGKPLLVRCIESMSPLCDRIIVVGGFNFDQLLELVQAQPKVTVVRNEAYESGMFSSVKRGIREVGADRFFIIPGDQPVVRTDTFRKLLEIDDDIVIPRYDGKKGHPVLFKSQLIPGIQAMPDTANLRDFIHRQQAAVLDVDDPGIGLDVDNPADYAKIKAYYQEEML